MDDTEGLLPGMNVNADIVVAEIKGVLTIPNEAVERGNVVLITEDSPSAANKIDKESPEGYVYVEVEVGLSDDDNVEIVSGLQENDVVAYISKSSSSIFNLIMAGNPQGGEPPMPGRP